MTRNIDILIVSSGFIDQPGLTCRICWAGPSTLNWNQYSLQAQRRLRCKHLLLFIDDLRSLILLKGFQNISQKLSTSIESYQIIKNIFNVKHLIPVTFPSLHLCQINFLLNKVSWKGSSFTQHFTNLYVKDFIHVFNELNMPVLMCLTSCIER